MLEERFQSTAPALLAARNTNHDTVAAVVVAAAAAAVGAPFLLVDLGPIGKKLRGREEERRKSRMCE